MICDVDERRLHQCIDAVYDAAVSPALWPVALERLASLFHGGFVDLFTRSHDRQHFNGLAHGLDRADYEDNFLGFWFKRNVWALKKPVRVAGEVISTRRMVDPDELRRSEIYNDYLHPRGLHEGLRLSLWMGATDLQDISILRPWSSGPFGPAEEALGEVLLPHLQRATSVTRRLRQVDFRFDLRSEDSGASRFAVILFDKAGVPFWFNTAARSLLAEGRVIRITGLELQSLSASATRAIRHAVALATGAAGSLRQGTNVPLPGPLASGASNLVVLPMSNPGDWTLSRPPAAVAFLRVSAASLLSQRVLRDVFSLTKSEAEVALALVGGCSLRAIAETSGRSFHTVRSHLARLMEKTGARKQIDLVRLLNDVATFGPARSTEPVRPN